MEYSVEPSDDGQYVVVKMTGDIDREGAIEITRARYALGRELGVNCYLLDATKARNVDGPLDNVHFTKEDLLEAGFASGSECVALLVHPQDHSHDFYAAFARRMGIDTEIFWERSAAIWHLREAAKTINPSPPPSQSGDS